MKKLLYIALALCQIFVLMSCGAKEASVTEETEPRYEALYLNTGEAGESSREYNGSFDFDSDGVSEKISVKCVGKDIEQMFQGEKETFFQNEYISVKVGEKITKFEDYVGVIDSIYVCDIDENDGMYDLAVITEDLGISKMLRIYKYGSKLIPYEFMVEGFDGSKVKLPVLSVSSFEKTVFRIENDGSLVVQTVAGKSGMWETEKTYSRGESGIFEEIKPEYYEILPGFMEKQLENLQLSGKELEMWKKGYIKAYSDFTDKDLQISTDEYFKVKRDDGKGSIFVEKENGDSGWIYMGPDIEDDVRYSLNDKFFFLAE